MKTYKLTALALLTGLLTACGGGGGGGSNGDNKPASQPVNTEVAKPNTTTSTPANQPAAKPATKPATQPTAQPTTQPAAKPATQPTAKPVTQPATTKPNTTTPATKPKTQAVESVNLITTPDGAEINLKLSPQGLIESKTTYGRLKGMNNSDSFYGIWLNDAQKVRELSYQGNKTAVAEIPTSGKATYVGDAIWQSGYTGDFKKGGTTLLDVDFSEKTVEGSIKFSVLNGDGFRRDITLEKGKLSGADFSGQATVFGNSGGRYEGALFGKNAKEMAGMVEFKNNSNLDVTFGGKKQ